MRRTSLQAHTPAKSYKRTKPTMERPPSGQWFAIITNVNSEKKAALGLRSSFLTYLPVLVKKQKVGGRRALEAVVERPLFPRYLFVASREPAFRFYDLSGVNGVESIVRIEGRPMPIPHSVIEAIMRRDAAGEFVGPGVERDLTLEDLGLSTGGEVRITDGVFKDLSCIIKAIMPHSHARVMLNIFGRETLATVPLADLERVA